MKKYLNGLAGLLLSGAVGIAWAYVIFWSGIIPNFWQEPLCLIAELNWNKWFSCIVRLFPIITFLSGMLLYRFLRSCFRRLTNLFWQCVTLLSSTIFLSYIIFQSQYDNLILHCLLTLSCGVQYSMICQEKEYIGLQKMVPYIGMILFGAGIIAGALVRVSCSCCTYWSVAIMAFSYSLMLRTVSIEILPE